MGLLQKALETYDAMERLVGRYEEGKEPFAPIGHIIAEAHIVITIDADGIFVDAKLADKGTKIIIPATENSAGRSGTKPPPHPLCDKLEYVLKSNEDKHLLYVSQLECWVQSEFYHPKAEAVLRYVQSGTMAKDLQRASIPIDKKTSIVCWRVVGLGENSKTAVWEDISLMKSFTDYYLTNKRSSNNTCMLTGERTFITWKNLGGIVSYSPTAKIISANDSDNFTYRGRFVEPEEAASIGYIASQKAHNALKWIISSQKFSYGNRAFVCWNPQGITLPKLNMPTLFMDDEELPSYKVYKEVLHKKLMGYNAKFEHDTQVIIAAFEAATKGRLAVTYYNELIGSDFLERLAYWDETFCWPYSSRCISSASLHSTIKYAFGIPRGDPQKVEADETIIHGCMQKLLSCRIDRLSFPLEIVRALVTKAGNIQIYKGENREKLLHITCAAIQKYYIDHHKEAFDLALEPERKDRSYQWGRLLAVMEKIERDTYDAAENRETNAIRMQSVFIRRPGYATKIIMEQLKTAYYPKLKTGQRIYYDRLIGEIMDMLSQFNQDEYGKPLTESYLPGYYLQKNAFYTKKDNNETEDENYEV